MGKPSREASEGARPADTMTLEFQPPELLPDDVVKLQVCGGLSRQPQQTEHHRSPSWPRACARLPQGASLHRWKNSLLPNFNTHG